MSDSVQPVQLPLAAPVIDIKTGKITEVWRRVLQSLVTRTGGGSGTGPVVGATTIEFGDDDPIQGQQSASDAICAGDDTAQPVLSLFLSNILSEPDTLVSGRTIPPDLLAEDSTHRSTDPFVAAMMVSEG